LSRRKNLLDVASGNMQIMDCTMDKIVLGLYLWLVLGLRLELWSRLGFLSAWCNLQIHNPQSIYLLVAMCVLQIYIPITSVATYCEKSLSLTEMYLENP